MSRSGRESVGAAATGPRVLLIAASEICYHPRLVKAADAFHAAGYSVTAYNPLTGSADERMYREFIRGRPWGVVESDFRKRGGASAVRWLVGGLAQRAAARLDRRWPGGETVRLNKGFFGARRAVGPCDVVVVNLIDALPLAARLKAERGAFLIYDSQEFFTGQDRSPAEAEWVRRVEEKYIRRADLVLATTRCMADELRDLYALPAPVLRVRNAPAAPAAPAAEVSAPGGPPPRDRSLRLVWHGFQISLRGRGVDLILEALGRVAADVHLYLQGRQTPSRVAEVLAAADRAGVRDRLTLRPPAHPDRIVESIRGFDVGLIAEPVGDRNVRLTSSNKLFEYMHAGLAVIAPSFPGLDETVRSCEIGPSYPAGDAAALARAIEALAADPDRLDGCRRRSRAAAATITWDGDFRQVLEVVGREVPGRAGVPRSSSSGAAADRPGTGTGTGSETESANRGVSIPRPPR